MSSRPSLARLLRTEAELLDREYRDHDPVAFTRRLAERLAAEDAAAGVRTAVRAERPPAGGPPPAAPPSAPPSAPSPALSSALSSSGRGGSAVLRRSADSRADLRRDLHHLCTGVAAAADLDQLAVRLDRPGQKAATRTLGCLLYSTGRTADAVFWWHIAAQGGDHLAVHCLAVHYTAEGEEADARLWRDHARDLAESPDRLPEVVLGGDLPEDPAALVRALAEESEGAVVLTLREAVAPAPPRVPPQSRATAPRPVRGRALGPPRRSPARVR